MKSSIKNLLPIGITIVALSSTCYSSDNQESTQLAPIYTFIKDCKDTTDNDYAAFTELTCAPIKGFNIEITHQPPQFFNIHLIKDSTELSTDFIAVTNENPLEPGKAIEWHVENDQPRFMIFRLSWGTEESPLDMREYLVLNYVNKTDICSIATVNVKTNKNANQKVRDMMLEKFQEIKSCPETILKI